MTYPRNCIFTGLPSRHRLEITKDVHSWTRAVPCSKVYLICREDNRYRKILKRFEKEIIKCFYYTEIAEALGSSGSFFEEHPWVLTQQAKIKNILQEEIHKYEAMDKEELDAIFEALMKHRLNQLLPE